ncbi:hypothetical protein [Bifidobacterium vansinderenii]|uniref:Uncharacterized protein n=1 Tax=Bifidobacterium vansinderenii TaxID=1984871 RepID=A0A229VYF0_9BIFI|nr:hypothetical protein [Bifidobacterium vansinderenii]OXN00420.1 hypothetical protein Tam10B_1290 [Bifidobacterium vansinderenii]
MTDPVIVATDHKSLSELEISIQLGIGSIATAARMQVVRGENLLAVQCETYFATLLNYLHPDWHLVNANTLEGRPNVPGFDFISTMNLSKNRNAPSLDKNKGKETLLVSDVSQNNTHAKVLVQITAQESGENSKLNGKVEHSAKLTYWQKLDSNHKPVKNQTDYSDYELIVLFLTDRKLKKTQQTYTLKASSYDKEKDKYKPRGRKNHEVTVWTLCNINDQIMNYEPKGFPAGAPNYLSKKQEAFEQIEKDIRATTTSIEFKLIERDLVDESSSSPQVPSPQGTPRKEPFTDQVLVNKCVAYLKTQPLPAQFCTMSFVMKALKDFDTELDNTTTGWRKVIANLVEAHPLTPHNLNSGLFRSRDDYTNIADHGIHTIDFPLSHLNAKKEREQISTNEMDLPERLIIPTGEIPGENIDWEEHGNKKYSLRFFVPNAKFNDPIPLPRFIDVYALIVKAAEPVDPSLTADEREEQGRKKLAAYIRTLSWDPLPDPNSQPAPAPATKQNKTKN